MSYGAPPPPPPPPPPYGQHPPMPYGAPLPPTLPYASWGKRALAVLLDSACLLPFYLVAGIGAGVAGAAAEDGNGGAAVGIGIVVAVIGYVGALAFTIWNVFIRQGRTGQTIGKGVLGIRLLDEGTGRPIGALMAFVRQLVHVVDTMACYLGWLWPLWDAKRQTFADKILSTVVVEG